jgi:hypothetical protein
MARADSVSISCIPYAGSLVMEAATLPIVRDSGAGRRRSDLSRPVVRMSGILNNGR